MEDHRRTEIYTKRYDPGDDLEDHLTLPRRIGRKNPHLTVLHLAQVSTVLLRYADRIPPLFF